MSVDIIENMIKMDGKEDVMIGIKEEIKTENLEEIETESFDSNDFLDVVLKESEETMTKDKNKKHFL